MKTYGGVDLGIRWRWVLRFAPRSLYLWGREPPVSIGHETAWGRTAGLDAMETRKISCLCRESNHLARSPSLYRLSYIP
jgi:hypothetical protein